MVVGAAAAAAAVTSHVPATSAGEPWGRSEDWLGAASGRAPRLAHVTDAADRAVALAAYADETAGCRRCALAETRSRVVFGAGDPDAELMLVGEAPGFQEDQGTPPFAGEAGELIDRLLAGIGLGRDEIYVANVLKCRPPQNRDPLEAEIATCEPHLFRQVELVQPRVVATFGNFATKLLSGRPFGITKVHGQEHEVTVATRTVVLYPLFHPAAALYTPSMLRALEDDFARLPALLGRPETARSAEPESVPTLETAVLPDLAGSERQTVQLGLF